MKKLLKTIVAPALLLAFASVANADPVNVGDVQEKDRQDLRTKTISMAQCAIDSVFPYGAARDSHLASTYKTLQNLLKRLPGASYTERDEISKKAYGIRREFSAPWPEHGYKYSYAMAAHSVAMAANVGTYVSVHGNAWTVYKGNKDTVSYELTKEAVDSTAFWHNRRGLSQMNCS